MCCWSEIFGTLHSECAAGTEFCTRICLTGDPRSVALSLGNGDVCNEVHFESLSNIIILAAVDQMLKRLACAITSQNKKILIIPNMSKMVVSCGMMFQITIPPKSKSCKIVFFS